MDNNKALPFFSIIMPTYNRANLIIDSIKTAIAQDYQNFEIIVVDDGSTDNTEEVVLSLNHPKIIYHKKKKRRASGCPKHRNAAGKGRLCYLF